MSEAQPAPTDRRRWWIGGLIILGLAAFGYSSFSRSLATYTHDFSEVRTRGDELLQVPGVLDKSEPQRYDTAAGVFEFTMTDVTTRSDRLRVRYHRIKPSNFDQASQVVCVGTFKDGVFDARQLLVKCPSKEQQKLADAEGGG